MKYEGRLMNLGTVDSMNRTFAKDCVLTVPDKVPVCWNFNCKDISSVIGNAEIFRDEEGLSCKVNLTNEKLISDEYYVGGYYTNVKMHKEGTKTVIDAATLASMSIVLGPSDKSLIIRKCKEEK